MHDFSRFSCLCSGSTALLFTEAWVKITDVILLLPAEVNGCLWVKWCVYNIGVYKFLGVCGCICGCICGCLWVPMGGYECPWVFLGFMSFYECLWWVSRGFCWSMDICGGHGYLWQFIGLYECLWVFMSVYGCHGCLWVFMGVYGFLWVLVGFGVFSELWVLGIYGIYRFLTVFIDSTHFVCVRYY